MRWTWICLLLVACDPATPGTDAGLEDAGPPPPMTDAGPRAPLDYTDDAYWLCRPGMDGDECLTADLTATVIAPDETTSVLEHTVATDPAYDCFYVYPTVALSGRQGTVPESALADHSLMLDPLLSQAAPFTSQCRVFAPLYRQISFATYSRADAQDYLEDAYVDIDAAFERYLELAPDRPFVIMGHSQGAHMTRRLLQRVIAPDPALRARMIAGLLIGGDVLAPPGATTGGSFDDIPLCTSDEEVGCVIAYRTFAEGYPPTTPPNPEVACTNPAALAGGEGRLAGTYLPTRTNQEAFSIQSDLTAMFSTPFVMLPNLYAAECVTDAEGHHYLEIRVRPEPGDLRENPVPFDHTLFSPALLGLHVLDYNFVLADLQRVVAMKATAMGL
ncbi:MAG: DUF3089 domain-containing protein [Sandaracinaceae bacterium]|nr:DUF3089 domain-containing protein [Sandaracinaceae bacterium]